MARNKLSETRIRALTKTGVHGDGDGLYLRVRGPESKAWIFVWRRANRRREMGLGSYGDGTAAVSLARAREKAECIRQLLARGEDPAVPKRADRATTFADVMEDVLAAKEAEWRNPKHGDQWRMTLRTYAAPLHDLPVAGVTVNDVLETLRPHWVERPETASRLRGRIEAVLDAAKARGLRAGDNPASWKGGLKSLLPKQSKLTRGHHEAIEFSLLPAAIKRLRIAAGVSARAVEFAALTAARSGEVRGAVWDEIDLDNAVWTIPAIRMKAEREHRVPITERAIEILRAQHQRSRSDLVFEGGRDSKPISETAMTKALRSAAADDAITLHGLRSAFRDWAGDETHHPRDVIETALAHRLGDATEQAYRRKDALAKRRALMIDWGKFCEGASNG